MWLFYPWLMPTLLFPWQLFLNGISNFWIIVITMKNLHQIFIFLLVCASLDRRAWIWLAKTRTPLLIWYIPWTPYFLFAYVNLRITLSRWMILLAVFSMDWIWKILITVTLWSTHSTTEINYHNSDIVTDNFPLRLSTFRTLLPHRNLPVPLLMYDLKFDAKLMNDEHDELDLITFNSFCDYVNSNPKKITKNFY